MTPTADEWMILARQHNDCGTAACREIVQGVTPADDRFALAESAATHYRRAIACYEEVGRAGDKE